MITEILFITSKREEVIKCSLVMDWLIKYCAFVRWSIVHSVKKKDDINTF